MVAWTTQRSPCPEALGLPVRVCPALASGPPAPASGLSPAPGPSGSAAPCSAHPHLTPHGNDPVPSPSWASVSTTEPPPHSCPEQLHLQGARPGGVRGKQGPGAWGKPRPSGEATEICPLSAASQMTEARATAGPPPPPQTPGEKGEGSGSTPHTPQWALNPGHGSPWQGGLLPPSSLLSPPGLFRLLLSLLPVSLLQVRSSLGTNILSAMAAFAGTAILLMDFGVTNWVCCQTPPGVGTPRAC